MDFEIVLTTFWVLTFDWSLLGVAGLAYLKEYLNHHGHL